MLARATVAAAPTRQRNGNFAAARPSRLTEDWGIYNTSADIDLWGKLRPLRARARRLSTNNPLGQKYLRMCKKNIVGPDGITLQMKVPMKKGKKLNKKLNAEIEAAWKIFCDKKVCTVTGKMSMSQAQRFAVEQWKRDGEAIVRLVTYDRNPFNLALQFFDPDQLDSDFFLYTMPNGNQVRMGVEVDPYGKPVAYYMWNRHPDEMSSAPRFRIRVDARDIIQLYVEQRVGQTRGFPEMAPSMLPIHMIGKYAEAEVIAARTAAEKQGFFERAADSAGYEGERDAEDNLIMKAEPGMLEELPTGVSFKPWDAQHPTHAFPFFMKSQIRMAGAGLDVSYEAFANDREGVNYSSIRAGLLDERDTWKTEQSVMKDNFCQPIFERFLENAWLAGIIKLDGLPSDYFGYANWHARGWPWVDPLKDIQAAVLANENGYVTKSQQMGENGNDFEETIDEIKYEQDYITESGVKLGTDTKGVADTADDDAQPAANADAGAARLVKKFGTRALMAMRRLLLKAESEEDGELED
jgi:lambda family phage portal protein